MKFDSVIAYALHCHRIVLLSRSACLDVEFVSLQTIYGHFDIAV